MRTATVTTLGVLGMLTMASTGACVAPYGESTTTSEPAQTAAPTTPAKTAPSTATPREKSSAPPTNAPPPDLGSKNTAADAGVEAAAGACPQETPADGYLWRPPAPHVKACTAADIGFFEGQLSSNDVTFASLESGMRGRSVACANCIFSRVDDLAWGPIVFVSTEGAFQNWGSCYARAPGGSPACGHEVQNWFGCINDACQLCGSEAAVQACEDKVASDPAACGRFDPGKVCGPALESLNNACATAGQGVGVLCGP